jgi:DNA-directed RNA polymerase specialized sigma24 family protein
MTPPRPELNRLQNRALQHVAEACDRKKAARDHFDAADANFRKQVINAAKLGCSLDQIAEVAGISKGRVGQIVERTR